VRYRKENSAAAKTAMAANAMSKSGSVRMGLPWCGIHVAFGVGKFKTGRVFIVPLLSYWYFVNGRRGFPNSQAVFAERCPRP
jgi:hypothetical protein